MQSDPTVQNFDHESWLHGWCSGNKLPVCRFCSLIYAYYILEQHLFESSFYLTIRVAIFDKHRWNLEQSPIWYFITKKIFFLFSLVICRRFMFYARAIYLLITDNRPTRRVIERPWLGPFEHNQERSSGKNLFASRCESVFHPSWISKKISGLVHWAQDSTFLPIIQIVIWIYYLDHLTYLVTLAVNFLN